MVTKETETGSLNLLEIVEAFKSPINEEQAWALCYQIVKNVILRHHEDERRSSQSSSLQQRPRPRFPIITSMEDLELNRDGSVKLPMPSSSGTMLSRNSFIQEVSTFSIHLRFVVIDLLTSFL